MEYEHRFRQTKYDCLLFDLDDTLYPLNSGLAAQCRKNIGDYMVEKLGIEESKINDMCNLLYKNYGTTMAGLRAIGYKINYDDYHSFVHGRLPYENLKPDPVLRQILLSIPIRKVIFTNADKIHTVKVLRKLGLEDCFEGIICFETLNKNEEINYSLEEVRENNKSNIFDILDHFSRSQPSTEIPTSPVICKPSESAMILALSIAKINPQRTIFFEDSIRNIQAGKRIGLHTVLVGSSQRVKGADHALVSIHNIKEALPELWKEGEKPADVLYSGNVSIQTSVTA
ncbi:uncharacterized protein LOC110033969 [Phalaenopsis equestris]|uniref:uncharacterized protein LOC110033969 n=1 Tax=Phalaenopsis equestris TaxID=78828 RepID=UPI0009E5C1B2|nr:uncharacterized protein LOC110033969 [Phalaenopsis equestris]